MENAVCYSHLPSQTSLDVVTFGHSVTEPCHTFGPAVRPYYLFHYILKGQGTFSVNHTIYHLKAGQGFLIEPDYLTTYASDAEDPWVYVWIGFSGTDASHVIASIGLSQESPIFEGQEAEVLQQCVFNMLAHNYSKPSDTFAVLGNFYQFLSVIAASNQKILPSADSSLYIRQATRYIQDHFAESLTVEEIARHIGLNRSYFSSIFKEQTGQTPIAYIQNFRLTKAVYLLETTSLSVAAVACSCGYQQPESLTRIFQKKYGVSPADFRKRLK